MNETKEEILSLDWGAEWKDLYSKHHHIDSPEYWDMRAPGFGQKKGQSDYLGEFIRLLELEPGDSVFDMGCGNGGTAIPLAQADHEVLACDFSQGMLSRLHEDADALGVSERITTKCMSWEDDWSRFDITDKQVDVAFASRSLITADLEGSLEKLTRVARKRVCASIGTGYMPKVSRGIIKALGVSSALQPDYVYTFNILAQLGYHPEVRYINGNRHNHYASFDDAREHLVAMIESQGAHLSCEEQEIAKSNLDAWLKGSLKPNEHIGETNSHGEVEGAYKIDIENDIIWAFFSWEPVRY